MGQQLALPLEADGRNESRLRQAWMRSGMSVPYEQALQDRAIAICLRCLADAMQKRTEAGSAARSIHRRRFGGAH